ncbi:hypothetical protein WG66_000871 [Moniliophthora roreri]|nr:hypothetical protein WG66_000871 [Moniliophthora roreri]
MHHEPNLVVELTLNPPMTSISAIDGAAPSSSAMTSSQMPAKKPQRVITPEGTALLKDMYYKHDITNPNAEQASEILQQINALPGCEEYKQNNLRTWFYNERGERKRKQASKVQGRSMTLSITEATSGITQGDESASISSQTSKKRKTPQTESGGAEGAKKQRTAGSEANDRGSLVEKQLGKYPSHAKESQKPKLGPLTSEETTKLSKLFYDSNQRPNQETIRIWGQTLNVSTDEINRWVLTEQQKLGLIPVPAFPVKPFRSISFQQQLAQAITNGRLDAPAVQPLKLSSLSFRTKEKPKVPETGSPKPVQFVGDCPAFKTDMNHILLGVKKKLNMKDEEFEMIMNIYGRDLFENTKPLDAYTGAG